MTYLVYPPKEPYFVLAPKTDTSASVNAPVQDDSHVQNAVSEDGVEEVSHFDTDSQFDSDVVSVASETSTESGCFSWVSSHFSRVSTAHGQSSSAAGSRDNQQVPTKVTKPAELVRPCVRYVNWTLRNELPPTDDNLSCHLCHVELNESNQNLSAPTYMGVCDVCLNRLSKSRLYQDITNHIGGPPDIRKSLSCTYHGTRLLVHPIQGLFLALFARTLHVPVV